MKHILVKYRNFFLLLLVFIFCEAIVNPFRNFPLNDDWSYAKSVLVLLNEQRLDLGNWPAMTLVSHLVWGLLFVKVFGFSFSALHLSTLVSSFLGLLLLSHLTSRICKNRNTALIAAFCLYLNPLYFNLSNTFMTDVNFNTLVVLCCFLAYDFFERKKTSSLLVFYLASFALVFLRQYGLIVPLVFFALCFFIKERKVFFIWLSLVCTAALIIVFLTYESYLKANLPADTMYKFSGALNFLQAEFWQSFISNFSSRYKKILYHVLFYGFPFLIIFSFPLYQHLCLKKVIITSVLSTAFVLLLFKAEDFLTGNIFFDMNTGTETFYQSIMGTCCSPGHTYSTLFMSIMTALRFCFVSGSIIIIVLMLLYRKDLQKEKSKNLFSIFLALVFAGYLLLLLITPTYFDRYHIPLISLSLVGFTILSAGLKFSSALRAVPVLLFFFYISVFGTRDYYTLHETVQKAYDEIRLKETQTQTIFPSFELYCWNDGQSIHWNNFTNLNNCKYLIQFDPEPGFVLYKKYIFQRWFPPKKDSVSVFIKPEINSILTQ